MRHYALSPAHSLSAADTHTHEFGARLCAGYAEGIADGATTTREQLEAGAGINLDRVELPGCDPFVTVSNRNYGLSLSAYAAVQYLTN